MLLGDNGGRGAAADHRFSFPLEKINVPCTCCAVHTRPRPPGARSGARWGTLLLLLSLSLLPLLLLLLSLLPLALLD